MNIRRIAGAGGALLGVLGAYAAYENCCMLKTVHYTAAVPGLPRLVQISDLHKRRFGRHQEKLVQAVRAAEPELIVITGDLVSRDVTDYSGTAKLLEQLCAAAPVLAVFGNHELDLLPENAAALRRVMQKAGVRLLENETVTVGGIRFAGLPLTPDYYRGGGWFGFTGRCTCTAETVQAALGTCAPQTVLLAHNPLFFPAYAQWGAALTLSGHVHGGAVRLPVLGGMLSPERKFFPRYDKGQFRIGSSEMIVSGGLGKLRLWNPPEICVITAAGEGPAYDMA